MVEIGLRNKYGGDTEGHAVTAVVVAPSRARAAATTRVLGENWSYLHYPGEFSGAPGLEDGRYKVVWSVEDRIVACDEWVVAR